VKISAVVVPARRKSAITASRNIVTSSGRQGASRSYFAFADSGILEVHSGYLATRGTQRYYLGDGGGGDGDGGGGGVGGGVGGGDDGGGGGGDGSGSGSDSRLTDSAEMTRLMRSRKK